MSLTLNEMQELAALSAQQLQSISQINARKCYQCGKCTAGCPMAVYMDRMPNQIMHLVQMGLTEEALQSKTIWLCAACATCSVRCPKGIDVAHEMEALRVLAKRKHIVAEKDINAFHDVFLNSVRHHGRVYEVGLILGRNLKTGKLLRDAMYGLPYLQKRKISLTPERIQAKDEIEGIFVRAEKVLQRELEKAGEEK